MSARRIGLPCVLPQPEPRRVTLTFEMRPWPDPSPFPRLHLLRWWR